MNAAAGGATLVVANVGDPDAGYVGERFEQHGLELRRVWREKTVPREVPPGVGSVLLLGSEWSVANPVAPDVLEAECALVRAAGIAGIPVLGLCYGAQVLAHAHGGLVSTAAEAEVGLVEVDTVDEGLVPQGPWWAFHSDVIEPPAGAEVVARNRCGVQAFVLPHALGVQFHPEVRPAVLDEWFERLPEMAAVAGRSRAELVELAAGREDEARAAAHALVDTFLDRCA